MSKDVIVAMVGAITNFLQCGKEQRRFGSASARGALRFRELASSEV